MHLRFARYECKYLLREDTAQALAEYVKPYVDMDPFAARQPNRRYEISSIYLDDERFRLCWETLEGLNDRFKLRIRAYTDRPADPVFFEVKRRRDRKIAKQRARVRRSDMMRLIMTGEASSENMSPVEAGFYESFVAKMRWMDARPKVLVRYEREAYKGLYDDGVRVTFDRNLRCRAVDQLTNFFDVPGWQQVEGRKVILELKFNDKHPPWMTDAIRLFRLGRISYSKYAHCITTAYADHGLKMRAH